MTSTPDPVEPVDRVEELATVQRDGDATVGLHLARDRAARGDQERVHVTSRARGA